MKSHRASEVEKSASLSLERGSSRKSNHADQHREETDQIVESIASMDSNPPALSNAHDFGLQPVEESKGHFRVESHETAKFNSTAAPTKNEC